VPPSKLPNEVEFQDPYDVYRALCPANDTVLPPGWEKINYKGQVVYLDHLAREAHEELPWEVWRKRSSGQGGT